MRRILSGLLAAAAVSMVASAPAKADVTQVLVDGGGWNQFYFGDATFFPDFQTLGGDTIDFTFDLLATSTLRVVDGFNDGDQFSVTINGTTTDTSTPVFTGNNIFDQWYLPFIDPTIGASYSHATYILGPGSYVVTGKAILSPFGAGAAAISLGNELATPEPATWAMMLIGFGGLGAMLRRSRRRALATVAA